MIKKLTKREEKIKFGVGEEQNQNQHNASKLTARKRIGKLFDPNSFVEIIMFVKQEVFDARK